MRQYIRKQALIARGLIALFFLLFQTAIAFSKAEPGFETYWQDNQAEINTYRLKVMRYGQERVGQAVLIYVTEPFSESKRVKVEKWKDAKEPLFEALKLNMVRDFQTGIYPYHAMTSVFVRSQTFAPVKISLSVTEWCGQVFSELFFRSQNVEGHHSSYFENESGPVQIPWPEGTISEDSLFILLRGLRNDFLQPGEKKPFKMLPSLYYSRLEHKPLALENVEIEREATLSSLHTPMGRLETIKYTIRSLKEGLGIFQIDAKYPHRIVKWSLKSDLQGDLLGSDRLPYWKLNSNGDEKYLKQLGIKP